MGILERLEKRGTVTQGQPLRDPVLATWFGGNSTSSGASVTPETAMAHDAVYGCVRVLSETMAQPPLHVYRRTEKGKERAADHPLYPILHDRWNLRQTSFEGRETMTGHTCLRGDAFAQIVSGRDGRVLQIVPLHPDRCRPTAMPDGSVAVVYTPATGGQAVLLDGEYLRLPGMCLSWDGVTCMSPIQVHRETVGKGLAANEYGARFFGNNAVPKGGIKIPSALNDEAALKLRESWNRRHKGVENSNNIAIFDANMEWVDIGMTHEDAQYVDFMKFSVEQIARIYRVPLVLLQSTEKATSWGTGIEQFMLAFVTHTILPWAVRWEQRMNMSLLSEADRAAGYFIAFDLKGLLRGDAAARERLYKSMFNMGAISADEIRALEDMNEIEDDTGSRYYVPMNMVPTDKVDEVLEKNGPTPVPDENDEPPAEPAVRLIK